MAWMRPGRARRSPTMAGPKAGILLARSAWVKERITARPPLRLALAAIPGGLL